MNDTFLFNSIHYVLKNGSKDVIVPLESGSELIAILQCQIV
jgi:hypothetical protein